MSRTSDWPLPESAERTLLPQPAIQEMAGDSLCSGCYPLAFGFYPQARGHQMRRPDPQDWLVIYCVSGRAELTLGEARRHVSAGDLLLLPPGQPHGYRADPDDPWSLYWVHLEGSELAALFARLDPSSQYGLAIGLHEPLLSAFRDLLALAASGSGPATLVHAASLSRTLLSWALMLAQRPAPPATGLDLDTLHQFMQQNLHRRLTLRALCHAAGAGSPWQFIRHYRAATGQTPMQAFLHRKVARACYLLEVSDLSVAELAQRFGFDDPYYFSRLFRRLTGVSPSHYRQRGRASP